MKPIIDVHAHIFNGKDIPIKGYLLSREPETLIEKLLKICGLRSIFVRFVARCIRRKFIPEEEKGFFFDMMCTITMTVVYWCMGKQYKGWAKTLSKEVVDVATEMVDTYRKDGIDLYIPLVLDYEYWFKNSFDNPIDEQVNHIYENIVIPYKGMMHPFVSFDPARELASRKNMDNPDGTQKEFSSLQLVKDAIENKGFIGVKLYNSMGYKPFYNYTVDYKRRRIPLHERRYVFEGREYDEVLSELYDYCVENEVPITTHCGMYGIESYHNASFDFGKAKFWRDVLCKEKFKNLRLNLAHFGWHQKLRYHANESWVKDICEMFTEFNYLFADVALHKVMSEGNIPKFISDYKDICREYPSVKKRLLFGIDWHVSKRVKNFKQFKEQYLKVLKHDNLFSDEEIKDFFGGNALRFLGLLPGGKNRERLEKFYINNSIDPPEWFISIKN